MVAYDPLKAEAVEARKNPQVYSNEWKTGLMSACVADPGCCFLSTFCTWCAAYNNHKRALYNDMSRYVCCAGSCPCSGRLGESSCPELCLALEVFLCFPINVSTTRWMIQDQMKIQNTQCDNCLIGTMFVASYLACICSLAACIAGLLGVPAADEMAEGARLCNCISQSLYCSVCACMQTQHHVQLNERDRQTANGPTGSIAMQAPPVQTMR